MDEPGHKPSEEVALQLSQRAGRVPAVLSAEGWLLSLGAVSISGRERKSPAFLSVNQQSGQGLIGQDENFTVRALGGQEVTWPCSAGKLI